jgi:hypothetical protein
MCRRCHAPPAKTDLRGAHATARTTPITPSHAGTEPCRPLRLAERQPARSQIWLPKRTADQEQRPARPTPNVCMGSNWHQRRRERRP